MKERNVILLILLAFSAVAAVLVAGGRQLYALVVPPPRDTLVMRPDNPVNYRMADSALQFLRDGDVVLRTGADITSYMLRQMNRVDQTFSHCGIVMIENDTSFVYHSIGGEDNPDERLRREPAQWFFSPLNNERLGIARLDFSAAQIRRLHEIVREYHAARLRFDMDFDLKSDDRLYCAEFVYKAINRATGDTTWFPVSEMPGRRFVGVDNLYHNSHAKIVCDIPYK